MSPTKRVSFVALTTLLRNRFPEIADPGRAITSGHVIVDGAFVTNPSSRVRADAAIRVVTPKVLRGTQKLRGALESLPVPVTDAVALDLGAAAGGFTVALLEAGARRVYAVDAGSGQLRGSLRADPRVVNCERTNLGTLGRHVVPEPVGVVTIDLSYLALVDALPQLRQELLAPHAHLLALVKPTYELRAGALVADPGAVASAVTAVRRAMEGLGWSVEAEVPSAIAGSRGAVEVFLHGVRTATA
jgi:23S rRNA (cytidine1920-2'-O)/16S rRNA (cytidine1409-2'-O)-methyltransferase